MEFREEISFTAAALKRAKSTVGKWKNELGKG